ncbi:hypoxanthine phosphoribosyltransferase [Psychromonas marina]|uniref:Hypoxanthine phosphoribosyltransferase n=1 Tax=Psychromonas marina TaxID=88364 RepID=A0ABQ6DYB6_9GAMM|nr:phosphoribosyltransferase family protein [Psychromonas marina]GLS90142.1 hypoxanthine phosphoribosyltransferase [Psychromonas marina]
MKKIFLDEDSLIEQSFELATQIMASDFKPTFIVGLWRGGSSVGIYVQECLQTLGVKTDHISIRTSYGGMDSYQQESDNKQPIRVHGLTYLVKKLNADDKLLIVDDMYRSGKSSEAVISALKTRLRCNMPSDVRVATVWKKSSVETTCEPDYHVHATDDWVVFPYELQGLSLDEIKEHKSFAHNSVDPTRFIES